MSVTSPCTNNGICNFSISASAALQCLRFVTPASELVNVDKELAKRRLSILQDALEKINIKSKKEFLNKTTEVLFENKMKNQNKYFGRDMFLNSIIVESNEDLTGQLLNVKINNFNHNSLFGEIIINENKYYAA